MMKGDKKKIIMGAGALAAAGIAAYALRKKPEVEPVCTPGDTKCIGSDLYLCNSQGQWQVSAENSPACAVAPTPIAKIPIDSYELWLVAITALSPLDQLQVGQSVTIHFMLYKEPYDQRILLTSNWPIAVWTITQPDGSIMTQTCDCPGINNGGVYTLSCIATLPGTYQTDLNGYQFTFTVLPITSSVFNPAGIDLIWDCRPYSQQALINGTTEDGVTWEEFRGHLRHLWLAQDEIDALNYVINDLQFDLTSVDFTISPFLTGQNLGRYDLSIFGHVDTHNEKIGGCLSQATLGWHVMLVPHDLYLQGTLVIPGPRSAYPDFRRYTRIWTYPDPNNETILVPRPSLYSYQEGSGPNYHCGQSIGWGAVGSFQCRMTGPWTRWNPCANIRYKWGIKECLPGPTTFDENPAYVGEYLKLGDTYDVLIYVHALMIGGSWELRYYHVGQVTIS